MNWFIYACMPVYSVQMDYPVLRLNDGHGSYDVGGQADEPTEFTSEEIGEVLNMLHSSYGDKIAKFNVVDSNIYFS